MPNANKTDSGQLYLAWPSIFYLIVPGKFERNLAWVVFKLIVIIGSQGISDEIAF